MEDGRVVPLVQYVVCLAVTEAIKDLSLRNVSFYFLTLMFHILTSLLASLLDMPQGFRLMRTNINAYNYLKITLIHISLHRSSSTIRFPHLKG